MIRFTEEHRDLREMVADFSRGELSPGAEHVDESAEFPRARLTQMAELGLLGAPVPERFGGGDGDLRLLTIIWEELARGCASTAVVTLAHSASAWIVAQYGVEEIQSSYLPGLATGDRLATLATHEVLGDGTLASVDARAVQDGNCWRLSGTKSAAIACDQASMFLVTAREGDDGPLGLFLAETGEGVTTERGDGSFGLRGASIGSVQFEQVASHRIGGTDAARDAELIYEIGIAIVLAGVGRSAHDSACKYGSERVAFGRTIDRFDALKLKFAAAEVAVESSRLLAYRAAQLRDDGANARRAAHMARVQAGRTVHRLTQEAIQVLGGNGFSREYPVERAYRDAMSLSILDGAGDTHRLRLADLVIGIEA